MMIIQNWKVNSKNKVDKSHFALQCGGEHIFNEDAVAGERWERRRWRIQRLERVAAVGVQRSRTDGKAHTGHRNRGWGQAASNMFSIKIA